MTVLRMTSPVTPPSTSPGSADEAQAPQPSPRPAHRLSFSVAALLADTRKSPESTTRQDTSTISLESSSPISSYSPVRQDHVTTVPVTSNTPSKYPSDLRTNRYNLSASPNLEAKTPQYTCDSPGITTETRTTPSRYTDVELGLESPTDRHTSYGTIDYRIRTTTVTNATNATTTLNNNNNNNNNNNSNDDDDTPISTDNQVLIKCSAPSPKTTSNSQKDFGSQSPRSTSQEEGRSRCSEIEDIDDDDENSLVDVEDLQQHASSPTPVRPTPAYVGGFSTLGTIPGIPPGLHPAVWGAGHQAAAAAAAAAAATATFFPSHFGHHAPLNVLPDQGKEEDSRVYKRAGRVGGEYYGKEDEEKKEEEEEEEEDDDDGSKWRTRQDQMQPQETQTQPEAEDTVHDATVASSREEVS
ncbi:muscle segmentation homeobox-like [Vespula squamosa]|uniref:Muscle segmentation homeobox-like n=1 Tax=Vespula squamosa TaxID=30214 RepID=A0ABD1ZW79_VESSQ